MLQNYFFLNRFILEVNPLLENSKIEEIFSQEKSKLVLVTSKKDEVYFLEMCVIPGNSYLNLRKNYSRAKKNTVNFFDELIGQQINSVEIASDDRIIKLNCTNSDLFFAIRGKFTNIFTFTKDGISSFFKSINDQYLPLIEQEFKQTEFIRGWKSLNIILPTSENTLEDIRKKYPYIGSEIVKEVKARLRNESLDEITKLFNNVMDEIRSTSPCVFINEAEQEVHIGFAKFKSLPFTEKKIFESTPEAINFLLSKKYYLTYKYSKLKLIKNHLERELKKISNKINNLQFVIERGSKESEYNKFGNLLLANLDSIKSRMTSIEVDDIFADGEKINIGLNPKLSPQKNVENYFDKSRTEKISFAKNQQLLEKAKKEFDQLRQLNNSLNEIDSSKELDELMKKFKIKPQQETETKEDLGSKFKQYIIENKYKVFVGKDSKNNDLLTTRFAKQNDYWFHARGASGSHVVLRVDNTKEPVPKNVLKKAAALAAYHSKAKTAGIVPVSFTFKKYVVKKKGDPVGTVHLLREDVLLVRPEIPNGCEFVSQNLDMN